jgi:nucleotide-binding universal stress UspA family protein
MGGIFVAYGGRDHRTDVLEFAVEQAMSGGRDLVVYHVREDKSESVPEVREEIEFVVRKKDPSLVYDIEIDRQKDRSKRELLLEAVFETDRDFDYVVMGEIKRGPLEEITHSSLTKAVLNEHSIPVTLVPL